MVCFDIFSHIIKAVGGSMFISPYLLICIYNCSKVFPHASFTCCSTQHALFIVWMGPTLPPPSQISMSKPWEKNPPPLKPTNLLQLNKGLHHSSSIMLSGGWNIPLRKHVRSPLSREGYRLRIEKGVTRDGWIESELAGRGNRRPEVICDVIIGRRKSPSVGDTLGIPTELASLLTNTELETILI